MYLHQLELVPHQIGVVWGDAVFAADSGAVRRVVSHVDWRGFGYQLDAMVAPEQEVDGLARLALLRTTIHLFRRVGRGLPCYFCSRCWRTS